MLRLTLGIAGMTCGHCLNAVKKALAELPGVQVDSVRMGRAEVQFDSALMNADRIIAAIDAAGYVAVAL